MKIPSFHDNDGVIFKILNLIHKTDLSKIMNY